MMEAVHRYEGTVNQVMGDGIMALFGAPVAHEDHAVRACYAALDLQAALRRYAEELRRTHGVDVQVRVGLNSGEVVVRAIGSDLRMDYSAVGQTTHLAARMEQLARPGVTLLTADTLRLAEGYVEVTPLGPVPLKGLADPIEVYELAGLGLVRSRLGAAAARGLTRFVGRDAELEQLRQALGHAGAGHGQLVAIVGEPGVGKSRLVWEVTHSHRTHGWLVLHASSVSYGKATPPFLAVKSAILNPRNRERGLPDINAVVTLLDSVTGLPLAIVDGDWVTAVRTAGLSAVAARRLARPDASTAAFIGCGMQARSHLHAFAALFPLRRIRAFGGRENRDALCREAEAGGLSAAASESARDAVRDADLVITSVTFSPQLAPFLDARWLQPGCFATMTDLGASWLPDGMSAFDRIVIDDREQEAQMPKPLVDLALVAGDLTGLVNGDVPGRRSAAEKTAFIFRGLALGDLAVAALAYQRARLSGKGLEIARE
jgi:ornithine cyclodeaminase/alanine dehydrogenase-like protein (mu-crystallin family)